MKSSDKVVQFCEEKSSSKNMHVNLWSRTNCVETVWPRVWRKNSKGELGATVFLRRPVPPAAIGYLSARTLHEPTGSQICDEDQASGLAPSGRSGSTDFEPTCELGSSSPVNLGRW